MRIILDSKEYLIPGYSGNVACSRVGAIQYKNDQIDLSFLGYLTKIFYSKHIYNGDSVSIVTAADCWLGWYIYQQLPREKNVLFLIEEEPNIHSLLAVKGKRLNFYRKINIENLEDELRVTEQFLQISMRLIRVNTENADIKITNLFEEALKMIAREYSSTYKQYLSYIFYMIPIIQLYYIGYTWHEYYSILNEIHKYEQLPHIKFCNAIKKEYNFCKLIPLLDSIRSISYINNRIAIRTDDLDTTLDMLKAIGLKPKTKSRQNLLSKKGEINVSIN